MSRQIKCLAFIITAICATSSYGAEPYGMSCTGRINGKDVSQSVFISQQNYMDMAVVNGLTWTVYPISPHGNLGLMLIVSTKTAPNVYNNPVLNVASYGPGLDYIDNSAGNFLTCIMTTK
jgi:hypothetical protein